MKTVIVKTFDDSVNAYIAKTKLESESIFCFLVNENTTSLFPSHYGMLGLGIELRVDEKDLMIASKILKVSNTTSCQECGSTQIEWKPEKGILSKFILVLSLISFVPMGNLFAWECKRCGSRFDQ